MTRMNATLREAEEQMVARLKSSARTPGYWPQPRKTSHGWGRPRLGHGKGWWSLRFGPFLLQRWRCYGRGLGVYLTWPSHRTLRKPRDIKVYYQLSQEDGWRAVKPGRFQ